MQFLFLCRFLRISALCSTASCCLISSCSASSPFFFAFVAFFHCFPRIFLRWTESTFGGFLRILLYFTSLWISSYLLDLSRADNVSVPLEFCSSPLTLPNLIWTKIPEERSQHLVESMPHRIKEVLKGIRCSIRKVCRIQCLVSSCCISDCFLSD